MPERDELDLLIDSVVSSYGDTEFEPGLESRILASISAEEMTAKKRRGLPWVFALPAAAGVLLLLMLSGHQRTEPPSVHQLQIPSAQGTDVASAGVGSASLLRPARKENNASRLSQAHAREGKSTEKTAGLPKLDVFPTPQPLSSEEQTLVNLASSAPSVVRQSLVEAQKQAEAPLDIAAIQIQPLDPPDHGGN